MPSLYVRSAKNQKLEPRNTGKKTLKFCNILEAVQYKDDGTSKIWVLFDCNIIDSINIVLCQYEFKLEPIIIIQVTHNTIVILLFKRPS